MAYRQKTTEITRRKQQSPKAKNQRPRGITKEHPTRKSTRLRRIYSDHTRSSTIQTVRKRDDQAQAITSCKRKRGCNLDAEDPPSKRQRASPSDTVGERPSLQEPGILGRNPIQHYIQTGSWPKAWFEPDQETRKHLEDESLHALRPMQSFIDSLRPSKKKLSSSPLKRSSSSLSMSSTVDSDQLPRESKSKQYTTVYELRLQTKGSHMGEYRGPKDADNNEKNEKIKQDCKSLLKRREIHPQDTLFRDESFTQTCEKIRSRNEAVIVQDISRLIVPSAQNLAILGTPQLLDLYETVNEGWNRIHPFVGSRPQPDYAVGFDISAFTQEQHRILESFVGQPESSLLTYFLATPRMYFPFLTCEVKCGSEALDIADRQNAHSMTVAVRAVVLLFKLVRRLPEIDREILGFSVSHNDSSVRIFGHYAVIRGDDISYYRHLIRRFDLADSDGLERWTAYDFTKNVYEVWKPVHLQRITSALDEIPFYVKLDELPSISSQSTSFSQQFGDQDSQHPDTVSVPLDTQASTLDTASFPRNESQSRTPTTALTQATEAEPNTAGRSATQTIEPQAKKPKEKASSMETR
ncbi:MAG: hypothetical protein Q9228_001520 [Teloschistes exilis]